MLNLRNVATKAEFTAWIEHNIAHTQFTSVAQAQSMLSALENQMVAVNTKFISARVQNDMELFDERLVLGLENHQVQGAGPIRNFFRRIGQAIVNIATSVYNWLYEHGCIKVDGVPIWGGACL